VAATVGTDPLIGKQQQQQQQQQQNSKQQLRDEANYV
jgi:hypothetical protein